jgi:hypothetical protein
MRGFAYGMFTLGLRFDTLLGAIIAVADNLLIIAILTARLSGAPKLEYRLGIVLLLSIIPLGYLLVSSITAERSAMYILWIGLMLAYLLAELVLDYILQSQWRSARWMTIAYVILLFGATGGMVGAAAQAGRGWFLAAAATFFIMFALSFYQHAKTGM